MTDIEETIVAIYDAVADQSKWADLLDRFVDRVGAQGSIIFEWTEDGTDRRLTAPMHSGFYTSDGLDLYLQKCGHLEARDQQTLRRETTDADDIDVIDDAVFSQSVDQLKRDEHVKRLQKFGIFHRAAGVLNKDNRWINIFSVQLNAARKPLTGHERAYMARLLPHFAKALDLSVPMRQLRRENRDLLAAMDRLTIGLCVVDAKGRVVTENNEFTRQQDAHGTFRKSNTGELQFADETARKDLADFMGGAQRHGHRGARPRKEAIATGGTDLCVEISPLDTCDEIGSTPIGGYLICSTDTGQSIGCNTAAVKSAFGLTDTETALAQSMAEGWTNPEIAERRGRSVATVNVQVKSILAKSNCANRTQFVRSMTRFGASFLRPD